MSRLKVVRDMLARLPYLTQHVGNRVFHGQALGKPAFPYCVFNWITSRNVIHLGGNSGLKRHEVQIDFYGFDSTELAILADELDSLVGGLQPGSFWVWVDDERDEVESPVSQMEKGVRRSTVTLVVWI